MKNLYRITVLFLALIVSNLSAQNVIPFNSLTPSQYQTLKDNGQLPILYPELFAAPLVTNPNLSNTAVYPEQNLNNAKKAKAKAQSPQPQSPLTNCGTMAYEPPITTPTADLNGDMVSDTIVPFTNGVAPFYRNDDGTSPPFTLPFQFCFYGNILNGPGSTNPNIYVNNNGSISFGVSYGTPFTPPNFPTAGMTMIGGFFGDVDTRNDTSGLVYMRRMPHYAIFKWHKVGYFNNKVDKVNSFMIVISDGSSPIIPDQLNAAIFYGDMQWTTGSASGGTNGFGGTAATVGANAGDGVNFLKIGRFDHAGIDYDGPNGNNDGVDWLDNKSFYFSACASSANLPPVVLGLNICDTLSICLQDTFNYDFTFLGPELTQNVTVTVIPPLNAPGFSYSVDYTNPTAPVVHIVYTSDAAGYVQFQVFGTDNATPPLSSNVITVTLQATDLHGTAYTANAGCMMDNGAVWYDLTSGYPPFSISSDSGATFIAGDSIGTLGGGIYDVQLVDAGGCMLDTVITINQPNPPLFDTTYSTSPLHGFIDVKCPGENNGAAIVNVSGSPNSFFMYNWHVPPITTTTLTANMYGLAPNANVPGYPVYWLTAIDTTNHCRDSIPFIIQEPTPIVASIADNYITCANATGSLTAVVSGGTPPYSIAWVDAPLPIVGNVAANIPAGTYTINILDSNNCISTASGHLFDGSTLEHNIYLKDVQCNGGVDGSAAIMLHGGVPPYSINWHFSGAVVINVPTDTSYIPNLPRSTNYVVLHNNNGCADDTIVFSINEPDTLQTIITSFNTACYVAQTGGLKVDVVGGVSPYSYEWTYGQIVYTDKSINHLGTGDYGLKITDAHNCIFETTATVGYDTDMVVTAKPDFVYDPLSNNDLWVTVNKPGTYNYLWTNSEKLSNDTITNPIVSQLFFPEAFRVDVIDENGCTGFDSVYVDVTPLVYFPTAFSPNGDKINDTLEIKFSSLHISEFNFNIYDRWGGKIFSAEKPEFKWDGKVAGKDITQGVYNYDFSYIDNRNKRQLLRGMISVIR
jgi:gliding motility-associated-like protein